MNPVRLGINIDHVATVRNARGGEHPDPVRAALTAAEAGADGITAHLREDRRHIRDEDVMRLKNECSLPLNLEMAATEEMRKIALEVMPHAVCIVPEKRKEITTEGGLDVAFQKGYLKEYIKPLLAAGIRVSLFIDPAIAQLDAAKETGAQVVELHTGKYCEEYGKVGSRELEHIIKSVSHSSSIGLECHAGHGLSFVNVAGIAAIPDITELNI